MEAAKWSFKAHDAHLEPPDVLWLAYHGPATLEDARWALGMFREAAARGPIFLACDVSESSIDAQARNFLAREVKPEWFQGAVYIGAGFAQITMSKAINLALLFLGKPTIEMGFVDSADQARQWIERERARRARAAVPRK